MRTNLIILIIMTLIAPLSAVAQQEPKSRAAHVITAPLEFAPKAETIELIGSAQAVDAVKVFPAVADDIVTSVQFSPGQWVNSGTILVKLDSRHEENALELALIELRDAQRSLKRFEQLKQQNSASQLELDNAKIALEMAENRVSKARIELEDRIIRTPISGYAGITDVKVGDRVTKSTLITHIDNRKQLYIDVKVPEKAIDVIAPGKEVVVYNWISGHANLIGIITEIDSRIEESTRSIRTRISVDNQDDHFRPGMSFRATLTLNGAPFAVIPEASLLWGATGAYIWISNDNKAQRVDIDVIQRQDGFVLVDGDLSSDNILIVEGVQRLRNGQPLLDQYSKNRPTKGDK